MTHGIDITYAPTDTLKAVADDVWIVDGPAIRFGFPKMSFPTRMTVIRLPDDALFIHSPTPLPSDLKSAIDAIGTPRWIIGPNRIHYWWIPVWRDAYRAADVYLAPGIRRRARGRIDFPAHELARATGYPWDTSIATLPVRGRYMTECVFFHRPSRTLVLSDLIENFEAEKLGFWTRWLTRLGGAQDPDGQMPRDMRLTYPKAELRRALKIMVAWEPDRIILAHGRWYDRDAVNELRRAFRWLLDRS